MPYFDFRCAAGHETEELVSRLTRTITCACGRKAQRKLSVPNLVGVGGRAKAPRDQRVLKYGDYQEATQELDRAWSKIEQDSDGAVKRPDYFAMANRKAQDVLAGKAAPPQGWVDPI